MEATRPTIGSPPRRTRPPAAAGPSRALYPLAAAKERGSVVRRRIVVATIAAAAASALAAVAVAAHPLDGATYRGSFTGSASTTLSFKVSANGKRVSGFTMDVPPVGCQGGAFGNPKPGSAAVTKQGTFTATLTLYFAPRNSVNGKVVVTGTFASKGREHGTVSSIFTNKLFPKSCDKRVTYTTTG